MSGVTAFLSTQGASSSPPPSYLVSQDFETDFSGPPPSWNTTGDSTNINWHDTSSPLVGAASAATLSTGMAFTGYIDFTAQDEVWVFFALRVQTSSAFAFAFDLQSSGGTLITTGPWGDTSMVYQGGGNTSFPAVAASSGVIFYIWMHYKKGTGSNSVGELWVSTTTTLPVSPTVTFSNGTDTTQASRIVLDNSNGGVQYYWDYIRVSSTAIGSAPA